jgi:hypothetical protein
MRTCDLQIGTPQKFADLQLRNEPKNLLICDLWKKLAGPCNSCHLQDNLDQLFDRDNVETSSYPTQMVGSELQAQAL